MSDASFTNLDPFKASLKERIQEFQLQSVGQPQLDKLYELMGQLHVFSKTNTLPELNQVTQLVLSCVNPLKFGTLKLNAEFQRVLVDSLNVILHLMDNASTGVSANLKLEIETQLPRLIEASEVALQPKLQERKLNTVSPSNGLFEKLTQLSEESNSIRDQLLRNLQDSFLQEISLLKQEVSSLKEQIRSQQSVQATLNALQSKVDHLEKKLEQSIINRKRFNQSLKAIVESLQNLSLEEEIESASLKEAA